MTDRQTNLGDWDSPSIESGSMVRVAAGSAAAEQAEVLEVLDTPAGEHQPFGDDQTLAEYWSTQNRSIAPDETVVRVWFPGNYMEDTYETAIGAQTYDYPVSVLEPPRT